MGVLMWVPADWVAAGMTGLPDTDVEIVTLDGTQPPASVTDVEFYVPSFFTTPASIEVMRHMRRLRVVQALTAGVDRLRPHVPPGAVLCNARGAHDASTAEWVVAAMLGALRQFPLFALEQAVGRWAYQPTDQLAEKTVLIVGYGSIGAAVERRLAGFEVTVVRVARSPRPGVSIPSRCRRATRSGRCPGSSSPRTWRRPRRCRSAGWSSWPGSKRRRICAVIRSGM
jgi:phosphoglycerate dehydrogenase-like enzyme